MRCYFGDEMDMSDSETSAKGEWTDSAVKKSSRTIYGNIVEETEAAWDKHFGGPVKSLMFGADVAHCQELCAKFQEAGYDFRHSSYKMPREEVRQLVRDFKDGKFLGLCSVEQHVKGFDDPSVMCGIICRPLKKGFIKHIQMLGRIARAMAGKEFGLIIDFAGNVAGWAEETEALYEYGPNVLLKDGLKTTQDRVRKEGDERAEITCKRCGLILTPRSIACPSCGLTRGRRRSSMTYVDGQMKELSLSPKQAIRNKYKTEEQRKLVWQNILDYTSKLNVGNSEKYAAEKMAKKQYFAMFNEYPELNWGQGGNPGNNDIDSVVRDVIRDQLAPQWKKYLWRKEEVKI